MSEPNKASLRDRFTIHEPVGPSNPTLEEQAWRVVDVAESILPMDPAIENVRSLMHELLEEARRDALALRQKVREEAIQEAIEIRSRAHAEILAARDAALLAIESAVAGRAGVRRSGD